MQKKRHEPLGEINRWVVEALKASGMTMPELALKLSEDPNLGAYDKTTIYKMTRSRRVKAEEEAAISRITGYPRFQPSTEDVALREFKQLSDENQRKISSAIQVLLASQEPPES